MVQKLQRISLRCTSQKQCFFLNWHCSLIILLIQDYIWVIFEWYLLKIMVFLVMGRSAENIEEKEKTNRWKTLKSEEKEKRRIRGKSNNNNLWFWIILRSKTIWKKVVHTIKFYLQFLCVAGYLKHNDTSNLNIHKYTNYNIIEIDINRLGTTTQIFITMDYLITMSEKYLYLRKRKNIWQWHFLPTP